MPSTARAISLTSPTHGRRPAAPTRRRRRAAAHRELLARLRQIALQLLALFHQRGDARRHLVERGAQFARRGLGQRHGVVGVLARVVAGQRLDAADAGGNRAFAGHRNQADIAGAAHMGAAAQFDRPAERVAACARALLPIDTTRTSSPYFSPNSARAPASRASSTAISRVVTSSFSSTTSLAMSSMRASSSGVIGFWMHEVEAQPVRRHQRAALRDVVAEHLPQRLMQQMRRGVMGADRGAPGVIDFERQRRAGLQRALLHRAEMHEEIAGLLLRVGDAEAHALAGHHAGVADLAAGLRVKRRLVQHDRRRSRRP